MSLKPECAHEGCTREPTRFLRLEVPPVGFPGYANAIRGMVGIVMCKDHAHEATLEEFLTDDVKEAMIYGVRTIARSNVPPDFARARMTVGRVTDPDWIEWMRANAQQQGGGTA